MNQKTKEYRKEMAKKSKQLGLCVSCFENPIYIEHSKNYCEHCFLLRKKANQVYNESHRKENYGRTKRWMKNNPELVKQQRKKWRENNLEKSKLSCSRYKKQSLKYKEQQKQYRMEHKEEQSIRQRIWVSRNLDHYKEYQQHWRELNPKLSCEYTKRWQQKNKEKVRHYVKMRQNRKKGAEGTFSFGEWESLLLKYNHRCLSCGSSSDLQPDHVVPISRGGRNSIDNIQPLCGKCNRKKHTKTIDFRTEQNVILSL